MLTILIAGTALTIKVTATTAVVKAVAGAVTATACYAGAKLVKELID